MTHIDLTVLHPVRLMVVCMPDPLPPKALPLDALDRFTVDQLAQLLALSRFSRKPVKLKLHDAGLPNDAASVTKFLARIEIHSDRATIHQLASQIETGMRHHATDPRVKSRRTPDQST